MHLRNATFLVLLAIAVVSCGGADDTEAIELDTLPTTMDITAGNGEVVVDGAASVPGTVVTVTTEDDGSEVSTELGDDGVLRIDDGCGDDPECVVDVMVELDGPAGADVVTAGGDVSVTGLVGDIDVDSGGGDIALVSTQGSVQAVSDGGAVIATAIIAADSTFETGGGSADVTLDEPVDTLSAVTGGGALTVQLSGGPYAIDADTGGGSLDVHVDESDESPMEVTLRSGGGDITVYRR